MTLKLRGRSARWSLARGIGVAVLVAVSTPRVCASGLSSLQDATQLSDRITLAGLLDFCAERLDLDLEFDPSALEEEVFLRSAGSLTDEQVWSLANRLLAARDLTTIQRPGEGTLGVVSLGDAARWARIEPEIDEARAGYVRVARQLTHLNAGAAAEAIRPLLDGQAARVEPLGESKTLLLADLVPNLVQALDVLDRLDQPGVTTELLSRPLAHRRATDVLAQVERTLGAMNVVGSAELRGKLLAQPDEQSLLIVAPQEELGPWEELIARFDTAPLVETRSYLPRHHALDAVSQLVQATLDGDPKSTGRTRVRSDRLTGALQVTATEAQHRIVDDLFRRLDEAGTQSRWEVRSYPLQNRSSKEIVQRLQELIIGASDEPGPSDVLAVGEQTLVPSMLQDPEGVEPEEHAGTPPILFTEDPETNRILAYGEVGLLEHVEQLLAVLDVRRAQVLIEALVVTLTESQTRDLGVELQKLAVSSDTLFQLGSVFGLGSIAPTDSLPVGLGSGFTGAALDPSDFSALIRALETLSDGRSLTRPKVLANNNQPANLSSVLESPFISTNASDTVATTSFGGATSAGTTITVTPTIVEGHHVTLDYTVSISSFVGDSADPALPPPRQENSVASHVTVPDGYSVVVGGLELEQESRGESRVPVLGWLPILGQAFKSESTTRERVKFYVFIRADVLRHSGFADLRHASDRHRAELEVPDDWPRLEPRIMR